MLKKKQDKSHEIKEEKIHCLTVSSPTHLYHKGKRRATTTGIVRSSLTLPYVVKYQRPSVIMRIPVYRIKQV